jgi:hypothetical protein
METSRLRDLLARMIKGLFAPVILDENIRGGNEHGDGDVLVLGGLHRSFLYS